MTAIKDLTPGTRFTFTAEGFPVKAYEFIGMAGEGDTLRAIYRRLSTGELISDLWYNTDVRTLEAGDEYPVATATTSAGKELTVDGVTILGLTIVKRARRFDDIRIQRQEGTFLIAAAPRQ